MDDIVEFLLDLAGEIIELFIGRKKKDGQKKAEEGRKALLWSIVISLLLMLQALIAYIVLMINGANDLLPLLLVIFLGAAAWCGVSVYKIRK